MSIVETLLVFVGIPVLVYGLIAALILLPGAARTPRYRPGGQWPFEPVWYAPQPVRVPGAAAGPVFGGYGHADTGHSEVPAGHQTPALGAAPQANPGLVNPGAGAAAQDPARRDDVAPVRTARGGVHDTW